MTAPEGIPAGSGGRARSPDPAHCLYTARALRDFGDGFVSVLLAVYLTELGHSAWAVGLVAPAALLGSSITALAIGLFGRPDAQRALLLAASALMTATGLAFAVRARRRRKRHVGPARPRVGREPRPCRRLDGGGILGLAARHLRPAEDRLGPAAARRLPRREAAGGNRGRMSS